MYCLHWSEYPLHIIILISLFTKCHFEYSVWKVENTSTGVFSRTILGAGEARNRSARRLFWQLFLFTVPFHASLHICKRKTRYGASYPPLCVLLRTLARPSSNNHQTCLTHIWRNDYLECEDPDPAFQISSQSKPLSLSQPKHHWSKRPSTCGFDSCPRTLVFLFTIPLTDSLIKKPWSTQAPYTLPPILYR